MDFSESFAQETSPVLVGTEVLDLDDPRLELWYGTELDFLRLPGIVWMDGDLALGENNISASSTLTRSKNKMTNTNFKSDKQSAEFFDDGNVASSLAFAEPFEFNVWILVKWTVVVLILAAIATFFFRGKLVRLPIPQSSREMKLIESLVVDQRSRLHLVAIGGERFLVATDLTGVKSTTLIPNWNLNTELGDESLEVTETIDRSTAISISEAG